MRGRPSIPVSSKRAKLSISLSRESLARVDTEREQFSRSEYIDSLINNFDRSESQAHQENSRKNGIYYTPKTLAAFLAAKTCDFYFESGTEKTRINGNRREQVELNPGSLRILDPACGKGELLIAVWNELQSRLKGSQNRSHDKLSGAEQALTGIDLDSKALKCVRKRIKILGSSNGKSVAFRNIVKTNSLIPLNATDTSAGWTRLLNRFDAKDGFDIIVANPPWGADCEEYKNRLSRDYFTLMRGQYDTSDLFLELAIKLLKEGGLLAFIVPDSLFGLQRRQLRKLLLTETSIKFIGRFGEKIFENVNRSCAVIICQKRIPSNTSRVQCVRINPEVRRKIINGKSTYARAEKLNRLSVPQSRFLLNRNYVFDIDASKTDCDTLQTLTRSESVFSDYLTASRGVELSKSGRVYPCSSCNKWIPLPNVEQLPCPHCGNTIEVIKKFSDGIIHVNRRKGLSRLLTGEHVRRYELAGQLWIDPTYEGIKYKTRNTYRPPILLFRKTGVGISCTVNYESTLTTQVVYNFRLRDEYSKSIPIELFAALANSRAMYFFLVKTYGETEWKSHPYLTQSQIMQFPIPSKTILFGDKSVYIDRIVKRLRPILLERRPVTPHVDAMIEKNVSNVLGLSRSNYETIYRTINSVEQLLPVRALKLITVEDIFR